MANYVFAKYFIPLPNNGERYDLSKDELYELLERTYSKGYEDARNVYDDKRISSTATASTIWKEAYIEGGHYE